VTFTTHPDSTYQVDSLSVDGLLTTAIASYEFINVSADHTIRATFRETSPITGLYGMQGGWNLVSLPLTVSDRRASVVFPSAVSQAYSFQSGSGYSPRDTLTNGVGYWLKFPAQGTVSITGNIRLTDTVYVSPGWNLVGSITAPALVRNIEQVPSSIVTSLFYGYSGGYSSSDTLRPAAGYWVKVSQGGRLILR